MQNLATSQKQVALWIASFIFVAGLILSALIPPMQSPDEFDHLERAYLSSRGVITVEAPPGMSSGGKVDTGLLQYFNIFAAIIFKPDRKLSEQENERAKRIRWSGVEKFRPAPSGGFYLPLISLPQATGLFIGRTLDLSVDISYRLARLLNLLAISLVVFLAFSIYRPNPLVVAVLILPMSLFQISSATIDGLALALTTLSLSCFMRIQRDRDQSRPLYFYALALAVFILSAGRVYVVPMVGLVFLAAHYLGRKKYYYLAGLALALIMAWFVIALNTSVDTRIQVGASPLKDALLYLGHPWSTIKIFLATVADPAMLKNYGISFIGVLGWLDTSFYDWQYAVYGVALTLVAVFTFSPQGLKKERLPRLAILVCMGLSILLMFFALLITWNVYPAKIIQGVQGRYFLPMAIMLSYALAGGAPVWAGARRKLALALVVLMALLTLTSMPRLLLKRYYLSASLPQVVSLVCPDRHGQGPTFDLDHGKGWRVS